MLLAVVVCIKLGLWQQHKAEAKQVLQAQLDRRLQEAPVALPDNILDLEAWRYRRVKVKGSYDARYQILLDNQIDQSVAGYHVMTPLQLENGTRVLVNRGWVVAPADRASVPQIGTPAGVMEVEGIVWLPPEKYFALESTPGDEKWQMVWQNMDMKRYAASVPFAVQPFVIRLDAASGAGGFVRNWPKPAERIEVNVSYAYQWFGFALAFVVIYIVVNLRKNNA